MAKLPIIKSRRINKILCLTLLAMDGAFLLLGAFYALKGDPDMCRMLFFPAAISGMFAIFYGVLWFIYGRKEAKQQKRYEQAARAWSEPEEDLLDYHEFVLPREELVNVARKRLMKLCVAFGVTSVVMFVLLYGLILFTNGFAGLQHLFLVAGFCLLIVIPGSLIQFVFYRKYVASLPQAIRLMPGRLIVDSQQFAARDIIKISVSSYSSRNKTLSGWYRKMIVQTAEETYEYCLDYRMATGDTPYWTGYGNLLMALRGWAPANGVKLVVDYMN